MRHKQKGMLRNDVQRALGVDRAGTQERSVAAGQGAPGRSLQTAVAPDRRPFALSALPSVPVGAGAASVDPVVRAEGLGRGGSRHISRVISPSGRTELACGPIGPSVVATVTRTIAPTERSS